MNFYEALTCAVNDGKKIRQTDWGAGVYATSDERGYLTRQDGREINMYYNGGANATWEVYTKSVRFKDVKVGEAFTISSYPSDEYTKIQSVYGVNAIRTGGVAVFFDKDACVTLAD